VEFVQWINSFTPSTKDCSVNTCKGDELIWHDGQCYQAASTGPCIENEWLLLQNIIENRPVLRCKSRRCSENEVWINCTCVDISQKLARLDLLGSVCGEGNGWDILISPYGQGICSCKTPIQDGGICPSKVQDLDLSRIDFINTRKSELVEEEQQETVATRQNCQLRDNNCQKGSIPSIHTVDKDEESLQNIIDWLNNFPSPDDSACFNNNSEEDLARFEVDPKDSKDEKSTVSDCFKEGGVMFYGNCSKLLSSSSCNSPNQWLVMVENSSSLYLECQERPCQLASKTFYVQQLCQCLEQNSTAWCSNGEKKINNFGSSVCLCSDNQIFSPDDGKCYPELSNNKEKESCIFSDIKLGSQGPCPDGYLLLMNQDTGKPKCKKTDLPPFQYFHQSVNSHCNCNWKKGQFWPSVHC